MKLLLVIFSILLLIVSCNERNEDKNVFTDNHFKKFENRDEWRLRTEDGVSLFIREFGTGDTVLILHGGWGAEHRYLIEPFLKLSDRYHFVFYDQRGSLCSKCDDSLISVENHIEDVERIRKSLGIEELILVGHSMGGFLGMSYLQKYPEHVKGLILISSAPAIGSVEQLTSGLQEKALKRWERKEVTDSLNANGLELKIKDTYTDKQRGIWHRITFAALNLHHVRNWRKIQSAFFYNDKSAYLAAVSGPQRWDFTPALNNAKFPVTVIHGEDDYLPLSFHKEWLQKVPQVKLEIIHNAGHLSWIDRPEEFNSILLKALNRYK